MGDTLFPPPCRTGHLCNFILDSVFKSQQPPAGFDCAESSVDLNQVGGLHVSPIPSIATRLYSLTL